MTASLTEPPLSKEAVNRLLRVLSTDQLRHVAAVKDAMSPGQRARQELSVEAVDELLEMALRGDKPTLGWWRRQIKRACA